MGSGRKKTLLFSAGMLALVGLLTVVSRSTKPPQLPGDADHRSAASNRACAPCHGKGGATPLPPKHPPKDDCLHCHARER